MRYLSLLCIIFLSSCDTLIECAMDSGPHYNRGTLPNAYLDEYYSEEITASIKYATTDTLYSYSFSLSGKLPEGLYFDEAFPGSDTVILKGTPTKLGNYKFEISVQSYDEGYDWEGSETTYDWEVERDDEERNLCRNSYSKEFVINVVELDQ